MSTPPNCISLWGEWHSDGEPVLQAEDKGGEPEITVFANSCGANTPTPAYFKLLTRHH